MNSDVLFKNYSDEYRRLIPANPDDYAPTTPFTFMCWFKGKNSNLHHHICGHKNLGFSFSLKPIKKNSHLVAKIGIDEIISEEPIQNNVWYNLVLTWDGSTFKFYFNASLIGELKSSKITYGDDYDRSMWIYKNFIGSSAFQMTVASVGLWNRELSINEVIDIIMCKGVELTESLILFDFVDNSNIYGDKVPKSILQLVRLIKNDGPCQKIVTPDSSSSSISTESSDSTESSSSDSTESSSSDSTGSSSSDSTGSLSTESTGIASSLSTEILSSKSSDQSTSSSIKSESSDSTNSSSSKSVSSNSSYSTSSSSSDSTNSSSSDSTNSSFSSESGVIGDRGIFASGIYNGDMIQYISITTTGNASDFGDLTVDPTGELGSCSSSTRGIVTGSQTNNFSNYITISTLGNASNYGNLTVHRGSPAGLSNSTRGIFGGGYDYNYTVESDVIDYFTIASLANATDFGDLTVARGSLGSCSNTTRGIFTGGFISSGVNTIDYITIASIGNAADFGDLTVARSTNGCSNSTRGISFSGFTASGVVSEVIDYITIATLSNATDFGDITPNARGVGGALANSTRGIFGGGMGGSPFYGTFNNIDYITISTLSNSSDFGDLITANSYITGFSNAHGGL